ncbi:MAG: hypothetical protein AAFN93_27085, partial [Bacteroidota bacterium]
MRIISCFLFILLIHNAFGQEPTLVFPGGEGWKSIEEGDTLDFKVSVSPSAGLYLHYHVISDQYTIVLDSLGNFHWVPPYDLVNRVERTKVIPVIFEATDTSGQRIKESINFEVSHKNRPPIIESLPVFYVKQYSENQFNLNQLDQIRDPDNDPVVFIPQ